jgi:hypothetical protein
MTMFVGAAIASALDIIWTIFIAFVFIVVVPAVYMLPTIIGWRRRVPHLGSIAVINIFLGWTFIGWVVALAMAVRSVKSPDATA